MTSTETLDPRIRRSRAGGLASIAAAGTFVAGLVLYATLLSEYTTGDPTPAESMRFAIDHEAVLLAWHLVILIVFGVLLIPAVLAVHDRLRAAAPAISPIAAALGLIWAGLVIAAGMIANLGLQTAP